MKISDYFDLSKTVSIRGPVPESVAAGLAAPGAVAVAAPAAPKQAQLSLAWQILVYAILLASILSSRFLDLYRAGLGSQFTLDWQYLLFLAIASLAAFPLVYDKAQLSTDKPLLVQVAVIFATGMGWEKIIATAIGK